MNIENDVMKIILTLDYIILVLVFSLLTINHDEITRFNNRKLLNSNEVKTTEFALEKVKKDEITTIEKDNTVSYEKEVSTLPEANQTPKPVEVPKEPEVVKPNVVYDGLTLEELSAKLDRSLNSDLAGKGNLFVSYALELGIDPYMAVAIVLQETGCKWDCSQLVKQCNNVGGQQGSPSCGTTGYKAYATLDEGIKGFMDNLYYNYYAQGLTTPEAINTKYASSPTWATKINNYIYTIKAS